MSVMAEPEIIPPHEDAGFSGARVSVAHVKSLGVIGALLALLTMGAAVGVGLLMLFGKALVAALIVKLLWPLVFGPEFTQMVFGSQSVPFWKMFLLLASASVIAKMLWPSSWGGRR
ncbi:MAG: hypothetical protein ACHQ49_05140 [Elusimicrobiota bacterium]